MHRFAGSDSSRDDQDLAGAADEATAITTGSKKGWSYRAEHVISSGWVTETAAAGSRLINR